MKAFILKSMLLVLLLSVVASSAYADASYVNPPPFTPQRTLFWDYSQSNWTQPTTIDGPAWGTGEMAGDSITYSGIDYFGTATPPMRAGVIGCDNSAGSSPVSGWMTAHVANYSTSNPVKYLWMEAELTMWGDVTSNAVFNGPGGDYTCEQLSSANTMVGTWVRANELWTIRPNPSWEEFTWTFTVPAGSGILVDKFYLSTACVPEPSSLLALGSGFMGMLGFAWRRRRA